MNNERFSSEVILVSLIRSMTYCQLCLYSFRKLNQTISSPFAAKTGKNNSLLWTSISTYSVTLDVGSSRAHEKVMTHVILFAFSWCCFLAFLNIKASLIYIYYLKKWFIFLLLSLLSLVPLEVDQPQVLRS